MSLASFVSRMNAAPGRAAWGRDEGRLPSCKALLRGDLFSQSLAPGLDSDSEGTRIWFPITSERGPQLRPQPRCVTTARTVRTPIRVCVWPPLFQTLHNVKTDWQPKKIFLFCLGMHPPCYAQALVPPGG